MNKKISVIGSGAMGTAISKVLSDSGHDILIYGIDNDELSNLEIGKNTKYFPDETKLPNFKTTSNLQTAVEYADYIVLALPSAVMGVVVQDIAKYLDKKMTFINVSKGFYPNTTTSLMEGIKNDLQNNQYFNGVVSIIGPSHAEEIVKAHPSLLCSVNEDQALSEEVKELFSTQYFKVYVQTDVIGAEVGSAYKNALAIMSGIVKGLGYGINTNAALITRGMAEMRRFNAAMGGTEETVMGLTGLGDLIVTATSNLSRNYSFGIQFVKDGSKALDTNKTVEGINSLKGIIKIAKEKNLYLPILQSLNNLLFGNLKLEDLSKTLLNGTSIYE